MKEADNYFESVSENYHQIDIISNEVKNMSLLNPDIPKFLANAKKFSVFIEVFNEFKNVVNLEKNLKDKKFRKKLDVSKRLFNG